MSSTTQSSRLTVAVAVQPPLLGELLGRALRAAGVDVVIVDGDSGVEVKHYDLAVVSGETGLDADVVIHLPAGGQPSGTARTSLGEEIVHVGDVEGVLDAVRRFV